jgi:Cu(I)/Ag(I) efflux system membrane fusion protein
MKRIPLVAMLVVAGALLAGAGYFFGRSTGASMPGPAAAASAPESRKVLYWHDPMTPGPRFDKPGKSPFMDMQLVPVYADSAAESGGVTVSPAVQQNLGIRLATARRAEVSSSFDAVGTVQFDERLVVAVQTRVAGYVERLSVRAPMERVRKGQALATVFAPEWLGPLNELIALQRANVSPDLLAAARERTRAMSIPPELVRRAEETGKADARFVLTAPASGVVAELGVREGASVGLGTTLFRIAGLEKVWAVAEVPEVQATRLVRGQKVKASLQADASQSFEGVLGEILPEVSASTRTLKARFEVDNRDGRLTPGMLLRLDVAGPKRTRLVVPSEAVIRTGKRAVVIVRMENGSFVPREVAIGAELGDELEVVEGLAEGAQVVASGQFLIDSEARLRSVLGAMASTAAPAAPAASNAPLATASLYAMQGKVESIEPDTITISHEPIAALKWPAMTMGFSRPTPASFADIQPGDTVHFEFRKGGAAGYELVTVHKLAAGARK